MNIHFLRHATFVIIIGDFTILVDPMLSEAGAMDPIANAGNELRIPLVGLPISETALQQLLQHIDAVVVTHTHRDHWDARAQALLPEHLPILSHTCSSRSKNNDGRTGEASSDSQ
ncbi:MAG: MBL fold metallo-hydrolase [Ktedonobacteraceae bacterium]|nr:MBL fold metallo-hydrolase [Ktedonobacteraceae bacterium]